MRRAFHLVLVATHAIAAFAARPPSALDECSGPVQPALNYGISRRVTPRGVPAPIGVNESLAEAVCCDKRALPFAEPQFLYKQPDIALFRHVTKTTTFYDSVCGLPVRPGVRCAIHPTRIDGVAAS